VDQGTLTQRRWWLLLVATALVARLVWIVALEPREPRFDERQYLLHARNLATGNGFTDEAGRPDAFWPPGYPAVLSVCYRIFGDSSFVAIGLQVVLGIVTVVLVAVMGTAAFGMRIGRGAALLLAVYPTHVFYSTLYLTEPLFTLLVVIAMLLTWRSLASGAAVMIAAGAVLGLAAYVRPMILLFSVVLPLWYWREKWLFRRAIAGAALAAGGTLIVVSPWLVRNHGLTGSWTQIATEGSYNLWVGNYPGALGGYAHRRDIHDPVQNGGIYDYSRDYRLARSAIAASPGRALLRGVQKASYFFALETDGVLWNFKGLARSPPWVVGMMLLGLANAAYIWVVGFAVLGLLGTSRSHPLARLLALLTCYMVLVTAVFISDPRYHYALIPLAVPFSIKGWMEERPMLWPALRAHEPGALRKLLVWSALLGLFFVLMAGNLVLKFMERQQHFT
jgi:4-amino-4-deoxy-L-arabinose transferase-like glycosyltransferase